MLFAFGVWSVNVKRMKGCATSWEHARVIAPNHTSLLDAVVVIYLWLPSTVAKNGVEKMPIIGTVCKVMTHLFDDPSRQTARVLVLKLPLFHHSLRIQSPLLVSLFTLTLHSPWRFQTLTRAHSHTNTHEHTRKYPAKAMQTNFVDRLNGNSRTATLNAICERARDPRHAPVAIFPEGTCTNGTVSKFNH